MNRLQEIVSQFPIRKSDEQKEAFRKWARGIAENAGISSRTEEDGKHLNFVAGDPDTAKVIFTAHYDTPANMLLPNLIIPRNIPLFVLYQLVVVGILMVISLGAAYGVSRLTGERRFGLITFFIVYYAFLFLIMMGPANRNNVNDNTSGTATVLSLMESLDPEVRSNAAFILFDNEEKGKQGSKAFAKKHPEIKKNTLVINMDCIGVGDHMIFTCKNFARALGDYGILEQSFSEQDGITPHFYPSSGTMMNSDQSSFRRGIGVVACKRRSVVGFYTPNIHTKNDTFADERNIEYLVQSLGTFVNSLAEN
ncbi:MAG: M28 family peptidase [Clostridia bacterium]|nr:M28 family peptidase [Clostridia bacterium]